VASTSSGEDDAMALEERDKVENRKDMQEKSVQPSGYDGQNPATAGPGDTAVRSPTPETEKGQINPSAPNDINRTPEIKRHRDPG
jgi:hypothetical protein